jgi:hypothetical protein
MNAPGAENSATPKNMAMINPTAMSNAIIISILLPQK